MESTTEDIDETPPSDKSPSEQMFLLECQVKRIFISCPDLRLKLGSDDLIACLNTRLTLSFLNFPEIELCDEENYEKLQLGLTPSCGKSCLFPLSEQQIQPFTKQPVSPCSFCVLIRMYSLESPCGDSPSGMFIACCGIPMGEIFSDMLNQASEIMDVPVTCISQQEFPLLDAAGMEVGSIFASVRISCFGKIILAPISVGESPRKQTVTDVMNFNAEEGTYASEGCQEDSDGSTFDVKTETLCGGLMPLGDESDLDGVTISRTRGNVSQRTSETDWMEGFGKRPQTHETSLLSAEAGPQTVPESEFYEEIRAVVNGHKLFFKVLRRSKKGTTCDGSGSEDRKKLRAVEPPRRDRTSVYGTRTNSKAAPCGERRSSKIKDQVTQTEAMRRCSQRAEGRKGSHGMGIRDSTDVRRAEEAQGRGGYRVSVEPRLEKQLKAEEDLIADGLIPVDDTLGKSAGHDEKDEDDAQVSESKSKEVFSLSVGKQVSSDGKVRPKLVLEIRAPKTKEDLDAEEAAIDAVEDRQKRREDRKKARELVADGTQYAASDFGPAEGSDGKKGGAAKKKGAKGGGKGKKGKK